ncbi:hypothetical protein [Niallia endozanthoxylica]|uniref:Uncharacterized protein n=1 Tax=Niallia endozanthoxylica TaxID=2036016 RepID=A0A5J5HMJ5_9BACI|nr:hypothetical protein [Niallia endozanthoxylica]KAA9022572.1 hypothetical protein F4V44_14960 [Niallia endozanthoxylica]
MTLSNAIRWLGLLAVIGGICRLLMTPLELVWGTDNTMALIIGGVTGSVFIIIGTAGIYLYQAEKAGILGFIGFFITTLGNILVCTMVMISLFVNTALQDPQVLEQDLPGPVVPIRIIMMIAMNLGYILFGIATLRAKVLPRWGGALMILLVLMTFIPYTEYLFAVVWGLFNIGLGWAVWSKSNGSENKVEVTQ